MFGMKERMLNLEVLALLAANAFERNRDDKNKLVVQVIASMLFGPHFRSLEEQLIDSNSKYILEVLKYTETGLFASMRYKRALDNISPELVKCIEKCDLYAGASLIGQSQSL